MPLLSSVKALSLGSHQLPLLQHTLPIIASFRENVLVDVSKLNRAAFYKYAPAQDFRLMCQFIFLGPEVRARGGEIRI